ncbi:MAG TPA: glycerate kinase [Prosthecobacter sp.]
MRVLIASDKYKGSLSAAQVAGIIAGELGKALPAGVEFDLCPIADGGEGTTDAMVTALGGEKRQVKTVDAQGRVLLASYGWCDGQAVMEMSAASGLALVNDIPLQPETASTLGTGELLRDALQTGAESVVIGIGGSATNDGGLGLAAALGYRFLDDAGQEVPPVLREILRASHVDVSQALVRQDNPCPVLVACDVDNPLLGPKGATRIYGPQKGVKDFGWFEERLAHLANLAARDLGMDPREIPGAGAAGGLGWGLMVFAGARLTNGFDLVAARIGLEERVARADLVITGEGRLDGQTLHGKGPVGIAQMACRMGKKVAAFAGSVEDSAELRSHFDLVRATKPAALPLPEAIARAGELLALAVRSSAGEIAGLLGAGL